MSETAAKIFFALICAAFLFNAGFMVYALLRRLLAAGRARAAAYSLAAAAAMGLWLWAFSGVAPRGGYDNEHDISYLCMSVFSPGGASFIRHGKEAAPLVADGAADLLSGYSLPAVLVKNKALMFASALLVFCAALLAGAGLPAAVLAFVLYAFSFLSGIAASTFSTTPANMFFLASALCAAAYLRREEAGAGGLAWFCAAFFLVWTSRYELAPLAGLAFAAAPGLRGWKRVLGSKAAAPLLAAVLLAAAAWGALALLPGSYNGPAEFEPVSLFKNLRYHLAEKNLSFAFGTGTPAVLVAAGLALLAAAASVLRGGRAARPWGAALGAACVYTAAIFSTRDLYPLHFARHQLYFFVPFIALFAAALRFAWGSASGAAGSAAKWSALLAFCAWYAAAGRSSALALNRELRTNDIEWGLLAEASRGWPEGCRLLFPGNDNRALLLRKYFPAEGSREDRLDGCRVKYLPPAAADFGTDREAPPQGYNPFSAQYREAAGPLFERRFVHKFYTVFSDRETREELPQTAGFYRSGTAADKAWQLNGRGFGLLKAGEFSGAERMFRDAAGIYPPCDVCRMNLAAVLSLSGRGKAALLELGRPDFKPVGAAAAGLAASLRAAASGERAGAQDGLRRVLGYNKSGVFPEMAETYLWLFRRADGGGLLSEARSPDVQGGH